MPAGTSLNEWSARRKGRYPHNKRIRETIIHALNGIGNLNPREQAVADQHLGEHGHQDRHPFDVLVANLLNSIPSLPLPTWESAMMWIQVIHSQYCRARQEYIWTRSSFFARKNRLAVFSRQFGRHYRQLFFLPSVLLHAQHQHINVTLLTKLF
jgi:hypothetical protein